MIIGDLIEEFIEHSGLHTFLSLGMDRDGMIEHEIDTLAFYRLSEDDGRVREEVKLLRKIGHIALEDRIGIDPWFCEDFVPLIEDENNSFFCLDRFSDDMLILMGDSLISIHDDRDDICSLDGSLRAQDTPLFDIRTSDLPCPSYPCGIDETNVSTLMIDDSIDRIASRTWHIFHDGSSLSGDSIDEG